MSHNYYHNQCYTLTPPPSPPLSPSSQLVEYLRQELQEKMERDMKQLQDTLDQEEDDMVHFRELDSQYLRNKLHLLPYTSSHK